MNIMIHEWVILYSFFITPVIFSYFTMIHSLLTVDANWLRTPNGTFIVSAIFF